MPKGWSAEAIIAVLGALTACVGGLAVAAVRVIEALKDMKLELLHSRALSDERAETLKEVIKGGAGNGGQPLN